MARGNEKAFWGSLLRKLPPQNRRRMKSGGTGVMVAPSSTHFPLFKLKASALSRCLTGAGEGIRTLDPNLGKVVLYP